MSCCKIFFSREHELAVTPATAKATHAAEGHRDGLAERVAVHPCEIWLPPSTVDTARIQQLGFALELFVSMALTRRLEASQRQDGGAEMMDAEVTSPITTASIKNTALR